MMTSNDFIAKALWIARNVPTEYALGMWGWKLTPEAVEKKAKQLPAFYTPGKIAYLESKPDHWGFDCVCLVKAILWGYGSNMNDPHGGAKYASNGVPDFGSNSIKEHSTLYTSDFTIIKPGAILHCPGHVGIYIGDGLAVECTAAWEARVIITAVANVGKRDGYHSRTWDEWGLLKYIDYSDKPAVDPDAQTVKELLTIYHYWSEIEKKLPWAYKPLRALYDAGLFSGASPADLNICRLKIECLVVQAKALKEQGFLNY